MVQKREGFQLTKDEHMIDIGVRIRELRNEQKMSQQQLAECIGVTTRTLQNYETHQRKLDIFRLPLRILPRVAADSFHYLTPIWILIRAIQKGLPLSDRP
ncbi:helix-turn-helix domain-containing protein [uncultured Mitsuokella sp.]|uniref:helix-turn-helix domain-containing protein n=1 Tax=uncultured Mitsuokella sp. TaxID=453120 RepID=UPI00266F6393|nr:helix-turn-helix transcriptional regulator [uncultured Mitsuokella sp.]